MRARSFAGSLAYSSMRWRVPQCSLWVTAAMLALVLISGCSSTQRAPVSERTSAAGAQATSAPTPTSQADPRPEYYTVKAGDTLISIALEQGLGARELAELNNLGATSVLKIGQQLRLRAPLSGAVTAPLKDAGRVEGKPAIGGAPASAAGSTARETIKSQPKAVKLPYSDEVLAQLSSTAQIKPVPGAVPKVEPRAETKSAVEDNEKIDWGWPGGGKLVSAFSETTNLKGIGISGKIGEPVIASAPGKVLFSGDYRGYGKLVIIKHNEVYLSVYAHNSQLLVKEGQMVRKGQKIAEMGKSDSDQVQLHFEIRRLGKPVDPLKLLPAPNPA